VVSGHLEDSLRHDIESYIEGRLNGIKQEIAALQSQLNESLNRLMDRQAEVQLDGAVATSILEHLRAAHEEGVDLAAAESSRAKASSDMAIVKAAISEISEQELQADILKVLVNRAATFAPRVAFFAIRGDQSIGWRARGFEGTVGDSAIHQMSFPITADTAVGTAARSRTPWSGGPGSHSEDHIIINRMGDEPPTRIVAVPLVVRNRSVAVLYADSANLDSEAINLEAIETLVRVSGMAVELLVGRSAPAPQAAAPQPAPQEERVEAEPYAYEPAPEPHAYERPAEQYHYEPRPAEPQHYEQPAYTPRAEYDEIAPVVEESAPVAEVTEVEPEPEPQWVEPEPAPYVQHTPEIQPAFEHVEPPQVVQAPVEVQAEVEAKIPLPAAPVTSAPEAAPRRRYGSDVELPVEVASEEERRFHTDARRFARLLVSEIKLYNEQKVSEGRSQSDLYARLREYIDRSREMYDKRVKPEVAQRYDYFHHELVATLAEGDEAKLGSTYPGATVSA
jgi:hypothetical protein